VLSVERDKDVIAACSGPGAGSEACKQKRTEAVLAQMGYEDGPYNSKYKDAYADEYQHINDILNVTSQKTQDQLAIRDAVAQNLAEKDNISLADAYKKYDRYAATRDVIAIVGGTIGGVGVANRIPGDKAPDITAVSGKKENLVKNADGIYEVKISTTPLEGHDRLNTPDIGGNGKVNPAEAAAAARLEGVLGKLERTSATGEKNVDFIISSGPNAGKTVDLMYTTKNLTQKEIDGMNKFYEKNMTVPRTPGGLPEGKKQILDHLDKADIVPIDFGVLTPSNQEVFMNFIKTLPKKQQGKIIIMR